MAASASGLGGRGVGVCVNGLITVPFPDCR